MKLTNSRIRAVLKKKYNDECVSDTEYVHYKMLVNELLNSNIFRNLDKRNKIKTKGVI